MNKQKENSRMPQQLSPQQFNDLVDIIGGLYGPEQPQQIQQPQLPAIKALRGRKPGHPTVAYSSRGPQGPEVHPTKGPQVPSVQAFASSQRPQRPVAAQPYKPVKTEYTPPTPEEKQTQEHILRAVEAGAKKIGQGRGTQLAHVLRARKIDSSIATQFEAVGVPSLGLLAKVLNGEQITHLPENLLYFHDDSSPFVVLSQPREPLSQNIPAVVVGLPYAGLVHELEEAFPGVAFFPAEEAPTELQRVASQTAKPMQAKAFKSLKIPKSRFGVYPKKDGEELKQPEPIKQPKTEAKPKQPDTPEQNIGSSSGVGQEDPKSSAMMSDIFATEDSASPIEAEPVEEEPFDSLRQTRGPEEFNATSSGQMRSEAEEAKKEKDRQVREESSYEEMNEAALGFAEHYKLTQPATTSTYNTKLPTEKEIAAGKFRPFAAESNHQGNLGKVFVGGKPYFYKSGFRTNSVNFPELNLSLRNEVVTSHLGQILGVPMPTARATKPLDEFHAPHRALLTAWTEGHTVNEIMSGLEAYNHNRGIKKRSKYDNPADFMTVLESLVKPGDVDLQIFFAFAFRVSDRIEVNYMVSGNRLVSIDHEFQSPLTGGNINNNALYELKALREEKRNPQDYGDSVPLSRDVAKYLADRIHKTSKLWQKLIKQPKAQEELEKRTQCLKLFGQGYADTHGSFTEVQRRVFPGRIWQDA